MKKLSNILDQVKPTLPKDLWGDDNKLLPEHKEKILNYLYTSLTELGYAEYEAFITVIKIIGSACSYQYNRKSDLDTHIFIDWDIFKSLYFKDKTDEETLDEVWAILDFMNKENTLTLGSRPVEIFIETGKTTSVIESGVYNLTTDTWEKEPKPINSDFDIEEFYTEIYNGSVEIMESMDINLGQIRRDIHSIDLLQETIEAWDSKTQTIFKERLEKKLESLENEIQELIDKGAAVVEEKEKGYVQIGEGVINFKTLQRYGYMALIKHLEKLLEDVEPTEEITIEKVPEVKEIVKEMSLDKAITLMGMLEEVKDADLSGLRKDISKLATTKQSHWITDKGEVLSYNTHTDVYEYDREKMPKELVLELDKIFNSSKDDPDEETFSEEFSDLIETGLINNYGWIRINGMTDNIIGIGVKNISTLLNYEEKVLPFLKNKKDIVIDAYNDVSAETSWNEINEKGLKEVLEEQSGVTVNAMAVQVDKNVYYTKPIFNSDTNAIEGYEVFDTEERSGVPLFTIKVKQNKTSPYVLQSLIKEKLEADRKQADLLNVCMYCGKQTGTTKSENTGTSHGICDECMKLSNGERDAMAREVNRKRREADEKYRKENENKLFKEEGSDIKEGDSVKFIENDIEVMLGVVEYLDIDENLVVIETWFAHEPEAKMMHTFDYADFEKKLYTGEIKIASLNKEADISERDISNIKKLYNSYVKGIKDADLLEEVKAFLYEEVGYAMENEYKNISIEDPDTGEDLSAGMAKAVKELTDNIQGTKDFDKCMLAIDKFLNWTHTKGDVFTKLEWLYSLEENEEGEYPSEQKEEKFSKIVKQVKRLSELAQELFEQGTGTVKGSINKKATIIEDLQKLYKGEMKGILDENLMFNIEFSLIEFFQKTVEEIIESGVYNEDDLKKLTDKINVWIPQLQKGPKLPARARMLNIDKIINDLHINNQIIESLVIDLMGNASPGRIEQWSKITDFLRKRHEVLEKGITKDEAKKEHWYRADTGYNHRDDVSAYDVVKFETDELGNEDMMTQAKPFIQELKKSKAKNIAWFTKDKEVAERYGTPDEIIMPEGYKVIATDNDGGYLLLKPRGTEWGYVGDSKEASNENIELDFTDECVGFHNGQKDMELGAWLRGQDVVVGILEYGIFNNEIEIGVIKVKEEYRRKGIGTQLWAELKRLYPNMPIDIGMKTKDGVEFFKKVSKFSPSFFTNPPDHGFDYQAPIDIVYPSTLANPYANTPENNDAQSNSKPKVTSDDFFDTRKQKRKRLRNRKDHRQPNTTWESENFGVPLPSTIVTKSDPGLYSQDGSDGEESVKNFATPPMKKLMHQLRMEAKKNRSKK